MPKRSRTLPRTASAPAKPLGRQARPGIIHTSLYLPEALYEGLREAAFRERCKIHDIVLEGIRDGAPEAGAEELMHWTRRRHAVRTSARGQKWKSQIGRGWNK